MNCLNLPDVLIVDCGSLLINAFESISDNGNKFKVTVSRAQSLTDLFFEISSINPDCVIMCELRSLTTQEALGNLMMTYPRLKVILISEDSNVLKILHKED